MNPAAQWPAIVREQSPLVWRTIHRLLSNESEAADCFQETFVCAWEFAKTSQVRNWSGLLQRLATARALDRLRRIRRETNRTQATVDWEEIAAIVPGPPKRVQDAELAESLRAALAQLPGEQSEIYCLRHLNDMSYQQIADETGITVNAVGVNLHRATERLRAALAPILVDQQNRR